MPSPSKRPAPPSSSEQKKRRRTSAEELKILDDAYLVNTLPSSEERARLAERTGMTPRAVQIWFQNKRQTEKRKLTQAMYPNVMIIPIHHPHPHPTIIDPALSTPGKSSSSAPQQQTPSSPWTTYHPHRPSHSHPGAPALAQVPYGGYIVQPLGARGAAGSPTGGQGYYPVGLQGFGHPHPHPHGHGYGYVAPPLPAPAAPAAPATEETKPDDRNDEERLHPVHEEDEKPVPQRTAQPHTAPWPYYGYQPYPYAMPPGGPATPTPASQGYPQHGQGYAAFPPPPPPGYGYPPPPAGGYGYAPYGYVPTAQAPAPTPAVVAAHGPETHVSVTTTSPPPPVAAAGAEKHDQHHHETQAPAPQTQTSIPPAGYPFASSSERENTGRRGYPPLERDAHDEEEAERARYPGSSGSLGPHSVHEAQPPTTTYADADAEGEEEEEEEEEAPARAAGDFRSRNSGEATRSGFRVIGDSSARGRVREEAGEGEGIGEEEEGGRNEDMEVGEGVKNEDEDDEHDVRDSVDTETIGEETVQPSPSATSAPQRPRSSLGFVEPRAHRGILDELCTRRELPFTSADEQDESYPRQAVAAELSSSPPLNSDSDPFGGSTLRIPVPRFGKSASSYHRGKRPMSAGELVIQRPGPRVPSRSRSPDIFDRMGSDAPSALSEDEEDVPMRLKRSGVVGAVLGGDLSDTDVEDDERGKQALTSSGSGEYAPPSSTSTLRTIALATPIHKLDSDDVPTVPTSGFEYTSALGGRTLRFVPSSAKGSGGDGGGGGGGKKRKLELTEDEDKENSGWTPLLGNGSTATRGVRPTLGRIASLDYYAGSPAKRSCSLGAEARRLSEVVSKYQQKAGPSHAQLATSVKAGRARHALGEIKANRKLNGSSSAHQFGKARASAAVKAANERLHPGGGAGVMRSLSLSNLAEGATPARANESSGGGTEDEECARLLLGLGSLR